MLHKNHIAILAGSLAAAVPTTVARPLYPSGDAPGDKNRPNIVIIYCDDLGYGDLSCYGNPSIKTPHLDLLATQGQKWSSFYVGASVSTPSRAALYTGKYPVRNGQHNVYFPETPGGLPHEDITIAELLQEAGYATALVGKWHLGHQKPENLPLSHGFDLFYGIPYSNDMSAKEQHLLGNMNYSNKLPFYDGDKIIEWESDQSLFTRRFTQYGCDFISRHRDKPFFLMLAHPMPHIPIYSSKEFEGRSAGGRYGDTVEEIDWSVGQIMEQLRASGLAENTLVIFSSDNGPWLITKYESGSAGVLREGKASAYEGGFRVPFIVWGSMIKPQLVTDMGSTLDILPTIAELVATELSASDIYDGESLLPTFEHGAVSPREGFVFYRSDEVYAVRVGDYKAIYATKPTYTRGDKVVYSTPELYNVAVDPSERYNIAEQYPEVLERIERYLSAHRASLLKE